MSDVKFWEIIFFPFLLAFQGFSNLIKLYFTLKRDYTSFFHLFSPFLRLRDSEFRVLYNYRSQRLDI